MTCEPCALGSERVLDDLHGGYRAGATTAVCHNGRQDSRVIVRHMAKYRNVQEASAPTAMGRQTPPAFQAYRETRPL